MSHLVKFKALKIGGLFRWAMAGDGGTRYKKTGARTYVTWGTRKPQWRMQSVFWPVWVDRRQLQVIPVAVERDWQDEAKQYQPV